MQSKSALTERIEQECLMDEARRGKRQVARGEATEWRNGCKAVGGEREVLRRGKLWWYDKCGGSSSRGDFSPRLLKWRRMGKRGDRQRVREELMDSMK
jgi:hypothetical protein